MGEQAYRARGLLVVVQRLAHAHENQILELFVRRQVLLRDQHLADDFGGGQAALKPGLAAGAKYATHRAAVLRRNTQRDARFLGRGVVAVVLVVFRRGRRVGVAVRQIRHRNDHAFDARALSKLEHQLARAVSCRVDLGDLGWRRKAVGLQPLAQRLGKIGHLLRIEYPALVDPTEHLLGAKRFLAERLHRFAPLFG